MCSEPVQICLIISNAFIYEVRLYFEHSTSLSGGNVVDSLCLLDMGRVTLDLRKLGN